MKGAALILVWAFALAFGEEEIIELNAQGCPVNPLIHKTIAHETYCNLFYNCLAGEPIEQRCPGNLVFNSEEGVCDWPLQVECGNKGMKEPESSEESSEEVNPGGNNVPSEAASICAAANSDGILVAHENCNWFYKCDRGLPVAIECYDGLLYNSELGICDWSYQVECGDRVVPTKAQMKRAALIQK